MDSELGFCEDCREEKHLGLKRAAAAAVIRSCGHRNQSKKEEKKQVLSEGRASRSRDRSRSASKPLERRRVGGKVGRLRKLFSSYGVH